MRFDQSHYDLVQNILLGHEKFNDLQKEFIDLFESKYIIAGPGTGKTTALSAKIILLLKKLKQTRSKDGICIITHTNVAVKEINNTLKKAGISEISHPHFIGTIHEFFNKFCVIPFFKNFLKHNNLIFSDDSSHEIEYYNGFINRKYSFMNSGAKKFIANVIHESQLVFNKESGLVDIVSDWPKFQNYKDEALKAKLTRKKNGFLHYDDTFLFSEIFLSYDGFANILRRRFKYIFIDEFQDTTPKGVVLLKDLFMTGSNNILQMIGDPFQTINFGQPMPEIDDSQVFNLNITNRFGKEIAKPLSVIMPNTKIQTVKGKSSFQPILMLYNNEKDIYDHFNNIIEEYSRDNVNFRDCKKKDKILVRNRNWASRIIEGVEYNNEKSKINNSKNIQLKNIVLDFIYKRIKYKNTNDDNLKKWVENHPEISGIHNILIDIMKRNFTIKSKSILKNLINEILKEKKADLIDLRSGIFKEIEKILNISNSEKKYGKIDHIFTIHSVKGESLRSALLVNFDDAPFNSILFSQYNIEENKNYNHTDHNLFYVAMSRVEHLFIYAINRSEITEEKLDSLKSHWIVREI
ncbi:UvrD-helicase domain-containing protein [Bacillus pumilus]|uniref:UvrD-helicase domain-containing protein n=1 Tax=Bacillus pumilus TaxID=1408 RepID=UPI0022828478|nr:UvrD-helicase domain-containing protein [Bacillus pumilus]MCY7433761.1 UvrD-helicase domain-containing protein [Bacillus pumilus]